MVLIQSQTKLNPGDKAPGFALEGVDGKVYSSKNFTDSEGFLIIFICNHCPYVKAKIDAVVKLHEKFKEKIALIGTNSNNPEYSGEGMENMKKFAQERGILFPYLLDGTQKVAKDYGAVCTPDSFLFDKNLQLVFHGRIDDALEPGQEVTESTMEENIQNMIEGREISKEHKPSMGCSIKWILS